MKNILNKGQIYLPNKKNEQSIKQNKMVNSIQVKTVSKQFRNNRKKI